MEKVKSLITICAVGIIVFAILPEVSAQEKEWSVTFETPVNSKYIWRGVNLVDDFVFQPSVSISRGGFSFSAWGSMEMTDINDYSGEYGNASMEFTEIDYTVDYSFSTDFINCSLGLINYQFPNTPFDSTTEVYGSLGISTVLEPTITIYQDIDQADGTYLNFSIAHSFAKTGSDVTVDVGSWISAGSSKHNLFYYMNNNWALADAGFSVSVPFPINEKTKIVTSINFSTFFDSDIRSRMENPDNVWFGTGFVYSY